MRSCSWLCLLIISSLFIYETRCYTGDEYEGSSCRNRDQSEGICRKITDCKPAFQMVVRLKQHHKFHRCGFVGNVEVVCCPSEFPGQVPTTSSEEIWTDDPVTKKPSKKPIPDVQAKQNDRKCVQVCEKYSKSIGAEISFQILNGRDAELGDFPHMAALGYESDENGIEWNCGGALVSENFVLTAAHCIVSNRGTPVRIRTGVVNLIGPDKVPPQDFEIAKAIVHPDYDIRQKRNDIALLKLSRPLNKTKYAHPACLYNKDDDPVGLKVTGWGAKLADMSKLGHDNLQEGVVTAVPLSECNATYAMKGGKPLFDTQICAKDSKIDSCQGDSGGPLQLQNRKGSSIYSIVGVISYGMGCGGKVPSVYTRVSKFLDWIESEVWPSDVKT